MKYQKNLLFIIGKTSLVLLLLLIVFVYAMFQGGFVSWFLFYSFVPFALYSLLLASYPLKSIRVTRSTNQNQYTAGEKLIGTITLERKIPFPFVYLVIEDLLSMQLHRCKQSKPAKVILFPWFKRKITYQYVIDAIPRGEHIFSHVRFKTGDLFGLLEKELIVPVHHKFLVYPRYEEMVYRQIENRFDQGMTTSRLRIQRDTTIAIGVRNYQPGDRFSWIDWKSSARKNDIMTKDFEQLQSDDVVLFMDRTISQSFEPVVTFSASLVPAILKKGAQLGFVSVGKDRAVYPLRTGEEQLGRIYYHLAKVQADQTISFAHVIESEMKKWQQTITLILVTSELTEELVQVIKKVSFWNANILVFVSKEHAEKLSNDELTAIESLTKQGIYTNVIHEGHYSEAFLEVSRS